MGAGRGCSPAAGGVGVDEATLAHCDGVGPHMLLVDRRWLIRSALGDPVR